MKQRISNFIDQMALDRQGGLWMATDNNILKFTLPDQSSVSSNGQELSNKYRI
jgi:ligand-binding sensor domain-containing protein